MGAVNGTDAAFNPIFVRAVQAFVIVFFGLMAVFRIVVAQISIYDAENVGCTQTSDTLRSIYLGIHMLLGLVELLLSAICIIPYTHRLYKIYKYMKQMDKEPDDKQHVILYNVIQKQCKLAFVLYGTSFMLFAVLSNVIRQRGIVQSFGYMDTIINGLCVYCTFGHDVYNKSVYRYLCNCNGIKSLQIIFCFCCWKCNESEEKETDESKLVSEMQSTSTTSKSTAQS